jgi:hypothetical protein
VTKLAQRRRHSDFEYILGEFTAYYKNSDKGMTEYQAWLNALHLDDSKPYGQSQEAFRWAKNMIELVREDKDNRYYRVLLGFPTRSMNRNVYKERDLIAAALSLKGLSPSVNHMDEFWLSPKNPQNRWGTVDVAGAKYEDGAVEVLLRVPKTTMCPVCDTGKPMYQLIDEHKIVNVSLEGGCQNNQSQGPNNVCDGFRFNEKGFSLLTSDVLPGIPMARIFPMESFFAFMPQKPAARKARIQIVGLKTTEGELSGGPNPDQQVPTKPMDAKGQCPEGWVFNAILKACVELPEDQKAAASKKNSNETQHTPEGTTVVMGTEAGPDDSNKPNMAMGDKGKSLTSDVGIKPPTMPGGQTVEDKNKECNLGGLPAPETVKDTPGATGSTFVPATPDDDKLNIEDKTGKEGAGPLPPAFKPLQGPKVLKGTAPSDTTDTQWQIEQSILADIEIVKKRSAEGAYPWDQCISDAMDKYGDMDTAKRVCGSIKAGAAYDPRLAGSKRELELSQALSRAATAESTLAQERIEHDAVAKGLKALVGQVNVKYETEKDQRIKLEGRLQELNTSVDSADEKTKRANNERLDLESKLQRRERDLQDALENVTKFKKLYEDIQREHEETLAKYGEALRTNIAVNKRITDQNEEWLRLSKENEDLLERLKSMKRHARRIVAKL